MKALLPLTGDVCSQKAETSTPFLGYNPTSLFVNQQIMAPQASEFTPQPVLPSFNVGSSKLQMVGQQVNHCTKAGPLSMLELVKLYTLQNT